MSGACGAIPFRQFHAVADRLYLCRADTREATFQTLYSQFFATLSCSDSLQMEFRAFPEIKVQVSEILVELAAAAAEAARQGCSQDAEVTLQSIESLPEEYNFSCGSDRQGVAI